VFDAIALWPDGVAVLGKPSPMQREAMIQARRPVVVCLDGDAWREAYALATLLRVEGQRAGFVRLGPGVDPDEVPRAELDARAAACLEA
jgi:DNA primase